MINAENRNETNNFILYICCNLIEIKFAIKYR